MQMAGKQYHFMLQLLRKVSQSEQLKRAALEYIQCCSDCDSFQLYQAAEREPIHGDWILWTWQKIITIAWGSWTDVGYFYTLCLFFRIANRPSAGGL